MEIVEKAIPVGGAALNFSVVGGTVQPENPKENTIWVETGVAIGEWQFSAVKPVARVDGSALVVGDVWLVTGSSGSVSINALRKNGVWLYPLLTSQWNGSAWETKPVLVHKNGEWRSLRVWLYNRGDQCMNETGGYNTTQRDDGTTVTYAAGYIQLSSNAANNGLWPTCKVHSAKACDFSPVSKLYMIGKVAARGSSGEIYGGMAVTSEDTKTEYASTSFPSTTGDFTKVLDVENIGKARIQLSVGSHETSASTDAHITVQVYEIYGE